ncbi:ArdC family protein [Calidifontibacillus erzurumensis]|uniref:ArdC family protein n=1 Tax=Calidifontibacillus erzurumensis TaxID=2741433 RepID=UPI0035B51D70
MNRIDIYQIVTDRIIEQLENGVVAWKKPWINGNAVNWLTQKPYRGINTLLLEPGEYATFNQIKEYGGKVKKGEKSHIVVFWKWIEKEVEETGEIEKFPLLRYYRVFEVNRQVEGLESRRKEQTFAHDPVEKAEEIIKGYVNCPTYSFKPGRAYYMPSIDHINVPPMEHFKNVHEYYSTMFHEMAHSTGHKDRLARKTLTSDVAPFGSEDYSKEELVAEITAAMLCAVAGIDNSTIENSASYIQSWLRRLKDDKRLIVSASSLAQRAADYILGKDWTEEYAML